MTTLTHNKYSISDFQKYVSFFFKHYLWDIQSEKYFYMSISCMVIILATIHKWANLWWQMFSDTLSEKENEQTDNGTII